MQVYAQCDYAPVCIFSVLQFRATNDNTPLSIIVKNSCTKMKQLPFVRLKRTYSKKKQLIQVFVNFKGLKIVRK